MMDRNKEAQTVMLTELQDEIKSLKSLLLNRRPTQATASATPSLPADNVSGIPIMTTTADGLSPRLSAAFGANSRPGIPPWQLKNQQTSAVASANVPIEHVNASALGEDVKENGPLVTESHTT